MLEDPSLPYGFRRACQRESATQHQRVVPDATGLVRAANHSAHIVQNRGQRAAWQHRWWMRLIAGMCYRALRVHNVAVIVRADQAERREIGVVRS